MYLIGGLSDQFLHFVWAQISRLPFTITIPHLAGFYVYEEYFFTHLAPMASSEPIIWTFLSLGLTFFGPIFYNIFLVITLIANFYSSHLLFKDSKYKTLFMLLFNFSAYFLIRFGQHPSLGLLFPFALFFVFFERGKSLPMIALLSITPLISNYTGYFLFILYGVLGISSFNRTKIIKTSLNSLLSLSLVTLFLWPYIRDNYFVPVPKSSDQINSRRVENSEVQFLYFTSRPWYFAIPSTKSPIYGDFAQSVYKKIESTGYYLANDYFADEHSANFFGYGFWIVFIILFSKYRGELNAREKGKLKLYLFAAILLFLFTLPPTFTLAGFKLYSPSYILFKFAPMFRSLARLSFLIYVLLLLCVAMFLSTGKIKNPKIYIILLALSLFEVFVPVKIQKVEAPDVYGYLSKNYTKMTRFAVFPYSATQEAMFWLPEHQQLLLNPRGYAGVTHKSEPFTKELTTDPGLEKLYMLGGRVLVLSPSTNESDLDFFLRSDKLEFKSIVDNYYLFDLIESEYE